MEQIEYQREKIEWSFIEFPDNQDRLDLIENKQTGILALLEDECKLPKATDEKFASRLYKQYQGHTRFSASNTEKRDFKFCVDHYAGPVVYSTHTFIGNYYHYYYYYYYYYHYYHYYYYNYHYDHIIIIIIISYYCYCCCCCCCCCGCVPLLLYYFYLSLLSLLSLLFSFFVIYLYFPPFFWVRNAFQYL